MTPQFDAAEILSFACLAALSYVVLVWGGYLDHFVY